MPQDRRNKASDNFREATPMFSRKAPFAEAFPTVATARVDVTEHTSSSSRLIAHMTEGEIGEYVDCTNPVCYGGGVSVGALLRSLVAADETHGEKIAGCKGYEGSPKGQRRIRDCLHSFTVTADLTYLEASSAPED